MLSRQTFPRAPLPSRQCMTAIRIWLRWSKRSATAKHHVRTEEHTRGHVLVVMLAYLIRRELGRAWTSLDVTVEEGLRQLQTLCSTEVKVDGGGSCLRIPTPHADTGALLQALDLRLPEALPHTETTVVTRKKLPTRRKPR